jgi:cobalt-zinc-cadmium efflux system membrane fusion protein
MKKWLRMAGVGVVVLVVLGGLALALGAVPAPWDAPPAMAVEVPPKPVLGVELVPGKPHTLQVPEAVRTALGIRKGDQDQITVAQPLWKDGKPLRWRTLVMSGSTALDPTRLYRIRARFAPSPSSAEVIEIAQVPDDPRQTGKTETVWREIRSGDRVKKGDLLAVFSSVDVGNKKNDLIDAIYQLELDQQILDKAKEHEDAVPPVFIWNAERSVQGDTNTVNRALATLRTWGIPESDIQAVKDEAEAVKKRKGKHDPAKDALWARVELRAPSDGVIIERNLALHEIVVDNTTNLFQIARVDRLAVFANCPEDDLPALEALPTALRRWTVKTVGSPDVPGFIDDISYLIDPNQHTAVVKGHINNPNEVLRGGQFISATVKLPPPREAKDEWSGVEVPTDAVVEDGQQVVVFVETDPVKHYYTMRRVELLQRFEDKVFVRSKPFARSEQHLPEEEPGMLPREPLRSGDRIVRSGVGELKAALIDLEAQPKTEGKKAKEP